MNNFVVHNRKKINQTYYIYIYIYISSRRISYKIRPPNPPHQTKIGSEIYILIILFNKFNYCSTLRIIHGLSYKKIIIRVRIHIGSEGVDCDISYWGGEQTTIYKGVKTFP